MVKGQGLEKKKVASNSVLSVCVLIEKNYTKSYKAVIYYAKLTTGNFKHFYGRSLPPLYK